MEGLTPRKRHSFHRNQKTSFLTCSYHSFSYCLHWTVCSETRTPANAALGMKACLMPPGARALEEIRAVRQRTAVDRYWTYNYTLNSNQAFVRFQ